MKIDWKIEEILVTNGTKNSNYMIKVPIYPTHRAYSARLMSLDFRKLLINSNWEIVVLNKNNL